jgi:hypothetical protein
MSLAAEDAGDRARQLAALTERLTDLIAADTRAFEARRPQDAAARMGETSELANLYRHESLRVRQDPSLLVGASLEERRRLVRATEAFEAVLSRHGRAIEAAKSITEGLVHAIANEVAAARASGTGYGAGGRRIAGDASSVTLNQRA